MKNYEVKIHATCVVYVANATDELEATDWAMDQMDEGDFEVLESEAKVVPDAGVESAKRHANLVVQP